MYALHLPDEEYRYIGLTNNPVGRFSSHKTLRKRTPVSQWCRDNQNFQMTIIDVLETHEQAQEMEKYWIEAAGGLDALLNSNKGGGAGSFGHKKNEEAKSQIRETQSRGTSKARKLDWDAIVDIRCQASISVPRDQIAREYGVTTAQIGRIINKECWKELEEFSI